MGSIEALYIFDEHNNTIVEHDYCGRPAPADVLLPAYLAQPIPRPSFFHLPNVTPPTLVASIIQDNLLFLCPTSIDVEPLLMLEFLHRVADALEDFLGAPLLAAKLDASSDVVAQVISEMCDSGAISTTEPNALKEVVEVPTWVGNFFGGFGLPASSPSLGVSSLQRPSSGYNRAPGSATPPATGSAIPWRRSNVRHTSNELYVDIIESLSVIIGPSGRPVSAVANGSIAFTSQISGVPDLLLKLNATGGANGIKKAMGLPCFHPCVRLARWRDQPGELSFVPPDGRFILAGYECDLLPDIFGSVPTSGKLNTPPISLPAMVELNTSLGPNGDELELRLSLPVRMMSGTESAASTTSRSRSGPGRFGTSSPSLGMSSNAAPSGVPPVENLAITIPLEESVRNVSDLRSSKGEAHYQPIERTIEWRIPAKEAVTIGAGVATMRCTLIGQSQYTESENVQNGGFTPTTGKYDYDESEDMSYQSGQADQTEPQIAEPLQNDAHDSPRVQQNVSLMPRSASLSFSVRGWLASGLKVESLNINTTTSKGLGSGVTPFKGVKYHTVSRRGIEVRC